MSEKLEKERLNLYLSRDLLERLEFCAARYGVSRVSLAVNLIGQGVAAIEQAFNISNNISNNLLDTLNKNENEEYNGEQ